MRGTPADPLQFMDESVWSQTVEYARARDWLFLLLYPLDLLVLGLVLIWGHRFRFWQRLLSRLRHPLLAAAAYALCLLLALFAFKLPFRFVSYRLAIGYGVSVQPALDWLKDRLITLALDAVIWSIAAVILYTLIHKTRRWWLYAWLIVVPWMLLSFYVQPIVIDPLYHQYSRLDHSQLEQRILALANQSGIEADRVYVAHMSEKTNALNAYVNGFGPSLRIVLWDTILERMEDDELMFIMAHEIGHYNMNHLNLAAAGSIAGALVILYAGATLYGIIVRRFKNGLGIDNGQQGPALPLLLLLLLLFQFASLPISNAVSRQAEQAADRYAFELIDNKEAAVRAFQSMAIASRSDLYPPRLIKWIRYTHPTIAERIEDAYRHEPGLQ